MPHTDTAVIDLGRPQKWFAIVQVFSQAHAYLKILTVKVKWLRKFFCFFSFFFCFLSFFWGGGTIMEQIWNIFEFSRGQLAKTNIAELYIAFGNEFLKNYVLEKGICNCKFNNVMCHQLIFAKAVTSFFLLKSIKNS